MKKNVVPAFGSFMIGVLTTFAPPYRQMCVPMLNVTKLVTYECFVFYHQLFITGCE